PGEDIALLATEGTHHLFVLGVADALHDHLPRGRGCDSAEALRSVLELHLVVLVLAGEDGDPATAAIEHDPGVFVPFRGLPVGRQEGLFDRFNEDVERDVAVRLDEPERTHINFHGVLPWLVAGTLVPRWPVKCRRGRRSGGRSRSRG